jgi:hypothetical protein
LSSAESATKHPPFRGASCVPNINRGSVSEADSLFTANPLAGLHNLVGAKADGLEFI